MSQIAVSFSVLKNNGKVIGIRLCSNPTDRISRQFCAIFPKHLNAGLAHVLVDTEKNEVHFQSPVHQTLTFRLGRDDTLQVQQLLTEGRVKIEIKSFGLPGFDICSAVVDVLKKKVG